ncbi:unnamed protein product [marine sediment metagenome]|uniref:Uncharacterized protein n=1 Tax=marine sediment metagenome TaxID=412755 RepID=X1JMS6_9ZZZZ
MTTGGRFYREKFKPPTIQYIEEHFQEFFNFMENISPEFVQYVTEMTENYVAYMTEMTENYVTYVKEMSAKVAVYLEQTVPIRMNCEGTLTNVATDVDFITTVATIPAAVGLIDADFDNLAKVFLLIIGRAVNTFAGVNNLDCTNPLHNQWMMNVNGRVHADLQNAAKADGQMLDTDWECRVEGAIHPFTFMFDITDRLAALDDAIGVRLTGGMARENNLIVTIDVYLKVVWKL